MEQRKFKVIEILALQSGTSERGEWKSQEVILEVVQNVQYPDRYLIRFNGEKVAMLADIRQDDIVTASWTASVRSFNTRDGRKAYAQSLNGWKIEKSLLTPTLPRNGEGSGRRWGECSKHLKLNN